ncbi:hypothetical protein VMCG_10886 [Cytospora schulzeri]|uniref:Methyltransferase domain-containing protein n=1 Tax=Cytospora schulzeri TaxID=448051 RepID=A0A423V8D5_9PEZI|nr:hypothetical protein VMCG_10886 [Valsa malicola]
MAPENTPPGLVSKEDGATQALFDHINNQYSDADEHNPAHLSAVTKLISILPRGARVLDIGCATGRPTARMLADAGMDVTGIDISRRMIETAQQNVPEGTFHHANAADFRAKEGSFDAVVAILAILTLPTASTTAIAFRIASWLCPGGALLLGQLDLNDFPKAEGQPADLRGEWVEHPFMDTFVRDNTMSVGEWINSLRQAGIVMSSASGTTFDIRPGKLVPEPECFVMGIRGTKDPLLGPYKHPYMHQPSPQPTPDSWECLTGRWKFSVGHGGEIFHKPAGDTQLRVCRLDGIPKTSEDASSINREEVELIWALDTLAEPESVIEDLTTTLRTSSSTSARISLVQASPSNDALYIVNRVLSFMMRPCLHHGALLQQVTNRLTARGFQVDTVELIPGYLDFSDESDADHRARLIAGLLKDLCFRDAADADFVERLLTLEVRRYITSQQDLTGNEQWLGFDSVRLTAVPCNPTK